MNQETEDFLAHYGVKGMKWGVRRKRSSAGDATSAEKARRKQGRKIIAKSVGLTLVAGAVAVVVANNANTKASGKASSVGAKAAKSILDKKGSTPVSKAGKAKISPDTKKTLDAMKKAHAAANKDANRILKEGYDRGMTPFPMREFLPDRG